MKKLFFIVLIIASAITYTSAQTAATTDAAHWSFALKGGLDYFNIYPGGDNITDNGSWGAGAAIEYTINPIVGVGLNLDYLNFNRSSIKGKTIDPSLFTSVNLSNLLYPKRNNAKLNFYANFGGGLSFGSSSDLVLPGGTYKRGASAMTDATNALAYTGASMEYNVSKVIGIGLDYTYRGYITPVSPYIEYNDANTLMATLRFKLGTGSKTHVRDMTTQDYYPLPAPVIKQVENPYDDSALKSRLDGLDKAGMDLNNRLKNLEADVKGLKDAAEGAKVSASFQNIEFDFNSDKITKASYPTLDQVAAILNANPTWGKLMINGHTDNVGSDAYNQKLSEARAAAVKKYLAGKGISEAAMSTAGYGESKPIADNATAAGRQNNRRVEFEISK